MRGLGNVVLAAEPFWLQSPGPAKIANSGDILCPVCPGELYLDYQAPSPPPRPDLADQWHGLPLMERLPEPTENVRCDSPTCGFDTPLDLPAMPTQVIRLHDEIARVSWPFYLRYIAMEVAFHFHPVLDLGIVSEQFLADRTGFALSTVQKALRLLVHGGTEKHVVWSESVVGKKRAKRTKRQLVPAEVTPIFRLLKLRQRGGGNWKTPVSVLVSLSSPAHYPCTAGATVRLAKE